MPETLSKFSSGVNIIAYGIEPRSLRYFVVVAELRNFNSASELLNISQPALTKSIQKMEDQLQVPLFDRHPRGLELTPFGRAFLRHAKSIQLTFQHAIREINNMRDSSHDTILIGAGPTWQSDLLPTALARFNRSHPNVFCRLSAGLPDKLASDVRTSKVDFAVAAFSENWQEDQANPNFSDLSIEPLINDDLVVVARKNHPVFSITQPTLQGLTEYQWATATAGSLQSQITAKIFGRGGFTPPTSIVECDNIVVRLGLVAQSDFLTLTSRRLIMSAWKDKVDVVDVPGATFRRQGGLILRRRATLSPATLSLIRELRAICAESSDGLNSQVS